MSGQDSRTVFRLSRSLLDVGGSVAMIAVAVILISPWVFGTRRSGTAGAASISLLRVDGAFTDGSATAPVTMVMYSDFECPFCSRFARNTLPTLRERYIKSGQLRLVFRNLPLERIHSNARLAAAAAVCAGWQGGFWDMHDRLFAYPSRLTEGAVRLSGTGLVPDVARFSDCLDESSTEAVLSADLNEAFLLGVSSTPTFLIGKAEPSGAVRIVERITGLAPIDRFDRAFKAARESDDD